MGGVVNVFRTQAAAEGNIDRLEEWDSRNLQEFREDKARPFN